MEQEKKRCPTCGRITSDREIALYRGLVEALWRVFKYCELKGVHEFNRRDIKHLLRNENDTARFGDLALFGLVYKNGKGRYGLPVARLEDFFAGRYQVPTKLWKSSQTGELRKEDYRTIGQIPTILALLNEDREYVARYQNPQVVHKAEKVNTLI